MVKNQVFMNAIYQDIDIVRGDTLAFNFQLKGLNGDVPDAITFSVSENINADPIFTSDLQDGITLVEYLTDLDLATYAVRLSPEKTNLLDIARYYYDLELRYSGDVLTLMRGRLTAVYDITRGV